MIGRSQVSGSVTAATRSLYRVRRARPTFEILAEDASVGSLFGTTRAQQLGGFTLVVFQRAPRSSSFSGDTMTDAEWEARCREAS